MDHVGKVNGLQARQHLAKDAPEPSLVHLRQSIESLPKGQVALLHHYVRETILHEGLHKADHVGMFVDLFHDLDLGQRTPDQHILQPAAARAITAAAAALGGRGAAGSGAGDASSAADCGHRLFVGRGLDAILLRHRPRDEDEGLAGSIGSSGRPPRLRGKASEQTSLGVADDDEVGAGLAAVEGAHGGAVDARRISQLPIHVPKVARQQFPQLGGQSRRQDRPAQCRAGFPRVDQIGRPLLGL
mmetsp:Transcript_123500/g.395008  ORF Transcript_123500/g.395008 Transcript_123500/m.395008 type:complete len:244 (-) Transcript_123500:675-1406(-)